MADIRKWFMKSHDKGNASKPALSPAALPKQSTQSQEQKVPGGKESSGRRKTSKHFPPNKPKPELDEEKETVQVPAKRKTQSGPASPAKKVQKVEDDDDDDFVMPQSKKKEATPSKKLKNASGKQLIALSPQLETPSQPPSCPSPCQIQCCSLSGSYSSVV